MKKASNVLRNFPLHIWLLMFTVIPLVTILFFAFFDVTDSGISFTTQYITDALTNSLYIKSTLRSLYFALISTIICLLAGFPIAYILSAMKERTRNFIIVLFLLPMWMNFLIRTYALMSLIDENGILSKLFTLLGMQGGKLTGTNAAIILGMVYNFLPFMVLPIYTSILKIDKRIIEAAQDLGGNTYIVFSKVVVPLTLPGIISGITMVFVPCVTTFVIPQLLSNKAWTIGSLIESKFSTEASSSGVSNIGAALSFLMMLLVFLCMWLFDKFDSDEDASGGMI